jgi:hypothetical protein
VYWHLLYGALGTEVAAKFSEYDGKWVMIQDTGNMKKWPICILLSDDHMSIVRTRVTIEIQKQVLFAASDPFGLEAPRRAVSDWVQSNSIEPHVQLPSTKFDNGGHPVRWHRPIDATQVGIFAKVAAGAVRLLVKPGGKALQKTTISVKRIELEDILTKKKDFAALVKSVEANATEVTGRAMEVVLADPDNEYPPHVLVATEEAQWPHVDATARGVYTYIQSILGGPDTLYFGEIPTYLDTLMAGTKWAFVSEVTAITFMQFVFTHM